jgi:hypothetical protein
MDFAWCTCASDKRKQHIQYRHGGVHQVYDRLCLVGHDVDKLLLVDLAVLVEIELVDHRLSVHA